MESAENVRKDFAGEKRDLNLVVVIKTKNAVARDAMPGNAVDFSAFRQRIFHDCHGQPAGEIVAG